MSSTTLTPSAMDKPVSLFTNKTFEISIISAVKDEVVAETFVEACEGMCQLGFKIKVMPAGHKVWQDACFKLEESYPDHFQVLESVATNRDDCLKHSQVVLFAENPGARDLKLLQKKGLVAVLPWPSCESFPMMMTFDAQQESGNCFLYTPGHTWDLVATMVRAYENYKFSWDWSQLKKRWKDTKVS